MIRHNSKSLFRRMPGAPRQSLPRRLERTTALAQRCFASNTKGKNMEPARHQQYKGEDPHQMADRFVKETSHGGRISGTEALESVPTSVKLRNAAMAATLVGFVTGVWWYSMNAVGRADEVSFELEAEEARERALLRKAREEEHQDLVELEMGGAAVDEDGEMAVEIGAVAVAVAAPDEIALQEEDKNRAVLKQSGNETQRPLWKRVIFFWRK